MKKGFTLIELLTVIIILGIVALIAFPFVNSTIERNKQKTFEASLNEAIKAAQMYMASEALTGNIVFTYNDERLAMEHNTFKQGTIEIKDGKIKIVNITDGEYCGSGTLGNLKIKKGDCTLNPSDYVDGTLLYYNPVTKETCSPTDVDYKYNYDINSIFSGSSSTGGKYDYNGRKLNGCLRWYVFNYDDDSKTYDAMLAETLFAESMYNHEVDLDEYTDVSNYSGAYKAIMNYELNYLKSIWNTDVRVITKSELESIVGDSITDYDLDMFGDSVIEYSASDIIQNYGVNIPNKYGWLVSDSIQIGGIESSFMGYGKGIISKSGSKYNFLSSIISTYFYGPSLVEFFEYKPIIKLSAEVEPNSSIIINASVTKKQDSFTENIGNPKVEFTVSGASEESYYCVTPLSNFRTCKFPSKLGNSPVSYTNSGTYGESSGPFSEMPEPTWKELKSSNSEELYVLTGEADGTTMSMVLPEYYVYVMTSDGQISAPARVSTWSNTLKATYLQQILDARNSSIDSGESGSGDNGSGDSGSGDSGSVH